MTTDKLPMTPSSPIRSDEVARFNRLAAIVGAELVFRVLPRGTHRWAQFVRPEELEQAAAACGLAPGERRGMAYLPGVHRAWWTRGLAVNYIASFGTPGDARAQGRVTDSSLSLGNG